MRPAAVVSRDGFQTPALGNAVGHYVDSHQPEIIQAHPANKPLTNIGELGMIFAENAYSMAGGGS